MEPRRRSGVVTLSLIGLPLGAMALASAFPGHPVRRNLYPDRAACERDYSPQQCAQGTSTGTSSSSGTSSGSGYRGGGWHGPYYYADRNAAGARGDPGMGRSGFYTPIETSTRGGFGAFGRAMHAGG